MSETGCTAAAITSSVARSTSRKPPKNTDRSTFPVLNSGNVNSWNAITNTTSPSTPARFSASRARGAARRRMLYGAIEERHRRAEKQAREAGERRVVREVDAEQRRDREQDRRTGGNREDREEHALAAEPP